AIVGTLAPFTLFAYGQSRVAAAVAAPFLNLEPLVGAAIGVMAFGDPFGLAQAAGAAAILAGIVVSSLPRAAAPAPVPATVSAEASGAVGVDELVHDGVEPAVDLLPRRVFVVPANDLPGALLETDDRPEVRYHRPQLGVVEHHRVRLVAQQPGAPVRVG